MFRLICALAVLAASSMARANPGDLYGALPRGSATAGTQTAAADDAGAAYYNPAGLGLAAAADGKAKVTLGYGAGVPLFFVDRARPESQHATQLPSWQGLAQGGLVVPLWGGFGGKGALGVTFFHPQDKLINVESLDPKTPHFLRYQSSPDRLVIAAGLGYRFGDFVSAGLGAHILASLGGQGDFDIALFERRVERRSLSIAMRTVPTPTAGVIVTPDSKWRIALAARGPMQLDISLPNILKLGDLGTLELTIAGVMHYAPPQASVGVQWAALDDWTFSADLKAELWGFAPNPALSVDVKVSGEVAEGLGLDDALSFRTNDGSPGFVHVLVPSASFEYRLPDKVSVLRGGYAWRPTHVPDQDKGTNWLDASAHVLGFGASLRFEDPTKLFSKPLFLDLALQAHVLMPREVKKTQSADAVGGMTFGGVAIAAGGAIRYEF